jgi:hypothetical protein
MQVLKPYYIIMGDADRAAKKTSEKVKKAVKDNTPITEDENKKHKLLLALGCLSTALGVGLTGWSGRQVDKCKWAAAHP